MIKALLLAKLKTPNLIFFCGARSLKVNKDAKYNKIRIFISKYFFDYFQTIKEFTIA